MSMFNSLVSSEAPFRRGIVMSQSRVLCMAPVPSSGPSTIIESGGCADAWNPKHKVRISLGALKNALGMIYSALALGHFGHGEQKQVERQIGTSSKLFPFVGLYSWVSNFLVYEVNDAGYRRTLAEKRRCSSAAALWDTPGCLWNSQLFVNSRQQTLFTHSWMPPETSKIKGLLVLLHGLNEHSGRYAHFARELNLQGYGVFGMDWIGHGGSDGLHGYVESLDYAVADIEEYLLKIVVDYPNVPVFLFGHSTGGAIALKASLRTSVENKLSGLILTSPAIRVRPAHPVIGVLAPFFSVVLPKFQVRGANKKGTPVTRDLEELSAKYKDPLVYTGPIRIRTGTEILRITEYLQKNMRRIRLPFIVLHGTDDTVTDPKASEELFNVAASEHKALKLYKSLLHDLLFEVERKEVTRDIVNWLECRIIKRHDSSELF